MPASNPNKEGEFSQPYIPTNSLVKGFRWQSKTNPDGSVKRTVPAVPKTNYNVEEMVVDPRRTFTGKFVSNPLIPLGLIATTFCLGAMARSILLNKDSAKGQFWMRGRVVAQGLTVIALLGGAYLMGEEDPRVNSRQKRAIPEIDSEQASDLYQSEEK